MFTHDAEKAEAMNLYFSSIGEKLARGLPRIPINNSENINARASGSDIISSIEFDQKLFEKALLKLTPGKAHGQDDISAKKLKVVGSRAQS